MTSSRAHALVAAFGAVGVALLFALKPTSSPVYADAKAEASPARAKTAPAPATPAKPAPTTGCPSEMARVGATCVDRYEASLLRRNDDGALVPHPNSARPTGRVFVAVSKAGVKPQGYISQLEAASACQNAGKRLCSLTEWYRSCRGDKNTLFPYGPTYVHGRCNVNKPHLLSMLHGSDPNAWKYDTGFNDPELDQR